MVNDLLLVVDVGTSSVRVVLARPDATVVAERRVPNLPATPFPGLVEFDAAHLATVVLTGCHELEARADAPIAAVGITNQRASTVLWDRATGVPVGPALGWQDLRTVGECLVLQGQGLRMAPNQSATKLAHLLDLHDADRQRDLCFGTVDTWLAWTLSQGAAHVTDGSNAGITGLVRPDGSAWDERVLAALRVPARVLPTIVDSAGPLGQATALAGSPPITALVGDQQASLIGQGCVRPGQAKLTFGTGGMLDVCVGPDRPGIDTRSEHGTFPIVAWRLGGKITWGIEAVMLAAGSNMEWLVEDLAVIPSAAASAEVAASVPDTGGVVYVPAPLGLGTPRWDFGARGTLLGATRGTTRAHLVRAVIEGVAHRGADLVEAAEADLGTPLEVLRADGGMTANPVFVQALADACSRPVELCPVVEGTTRGAILLAAAGAALLPSVGSAGELWSPREVVRPGQPLDRDRWRDAVDRAAGWYGDLSALSF